MPKKKLAIFDMDGTLVDTKDVNFYAYREALEEEGFSLSYEYYCKFCNGRHYTVFLPPLVGEDRELLTRIHNKKKAAYSKYLEKAKSNLHLISLIRIMKQEYYCALVTTASRKNCEELLNTFGLMELFDLILTMKHFNISTEQTIIFEDSETGIKAAEQTGADYYVVHGYN